MLRILSLSSLALVFALTLAQAADWSRFRGPNGTGVAEGTLPKIDPKAPLWKVEIPGKGNGSPIVVGGKVYLQTAATDGSTRTLLCLNAADGKTEWTKDMPGSMGKMSQAKNTLASSTPACDGESLYCAWWDGSGVAVHAYDLTGKEKWRTSLGGFNNGFGPAFSPIVHEGLVFANIVDDKRDELIAMDAKSGEKKWVVNRKPSRACFSTPFLLKRGDKAAELIVGNAGAITSYEPASGKVNWNYDISWPKGVNPLRVVAAPVYANGVIALQTGDGGGNRYMVGVDLEKPTPAKMWEKTRDTPYVPCPVAKGDLLFWVTDTPAFACCAEAKTGKILWTERVFPDKGATSSPVLVGDDILAIGEAGEVLVFKAAKEYEEVAKANLGEGVLATPAVADGKVFIRGNKHLFCFGKK